MENQSFEELTSKLIEAGFIAFWRMSPSGHPYVIAGTHQVGDDIKCIQNAIMITHDPNWVVDTTWPWQGDQEFVEKDFESVLAQAIAQLTSRK